MTKAIVFDMDGTFVDLYGVNNWLTDLRAENVRPYNVASALYPDEELNALVLTLKARGYKIIVTSWSSKGGSTEYNKAVKRAKVAWLKAHNFPADEIHVVKYGTPKHSVTRGKADYQILVDDNADVRKAWTLGNTIDANNNILEALMQLV